MEILLILAVFLFGVLIGVLIGYYEHKRIIEELISTAMPSAWDSGDDSYFIMKFTIGKGEPYIVKGEPYIVKESTNEE